jgi:hypothetical protein
MSGNVPAPNERNPERLSQAIRELFEGRSNAVGTFNLADDPATSTVVEAMNCGVDSQVLLMPRTADAAAALAAGDVYVSAVGQGNFTVTHPVDTSDREFGYVCLG